MADNLVSQLPLNAPIVDEQGRPSRGFAIWIRDIYKRTSYKGGNAIDDNKQAADKSFLEIDSSLNETIEQVNNSSTEIAENKDSITQTTETLTQHTESETEHGSNGKIVGFEDLASEAESGLVKKMSVLANAIESTIEIINPDVDAAPALYDQLHSQQLVNLTNANKAAINALVTDFNNAVIVLNDLISKSKSSGQMTE